MSNKLIPYTQLSLSAVIIGSSVVTGKWAAVKLPLFTFQTISLSFALAILLPLVWAIEKKRPALNGRDLLLQLGQAFLGMFLFRVLMLTGLRYTSAIDTGLITSTTPAIVALLSWIVLREKFTFWKVLGVFCSFLGVGVLQLSFIGGETGSGGGSVNERLLGLLLIFLAMLGEASLTILRKMTTDRISPLVGTTMVTFLAWLMFLPPAVWELQRHSIWSFHSWEWGLMAYYGLVVTAAGYLLWFLGMAKVPAGTAAVFTGCIPVSTVILSSLFLSEAIQWVHLLGMVLVTLGIWLHSLSINRIANLTKLSPLQSSE